VSDARGHAVHELTDKDREARHWQECSHPQCEGHITHAVTYEYATGHANRTAVARRLVCADHAARFANYHEVPIEPPRPIHRSTMDEAVQQINLDQ
jgi:hypothetical protein